VNEAKLLIGFEFDGSIVNGSVTVNVIRYVSGDNKFDTNASDEVFGCDSRFEVSESEGSEAIGFDSDTIDHAYCNETTEVDD
jgi:hypothetical protein